MSATASSPDTAPPPSARGTVRWWREPLLHFIVLGALLFGLDRAVNGRPDEAREIVVDEAVDAEAIKVFREARGREPGEDELYALRRVWLDNEVLYREGLALQMDKGDKAIRDRVIFKALSMINAGLQRPAADDAVLKEWFEKNRVKYDEPARYDFQEAVLAGDATEGAASAFAAALNGGTSSDEKAGLRVFKARPHPTIVQSYGPEFAQALEALPRDTWRALRQGDGWRVVKLDAVVAARPAVFESLRNVVHQDWTDHVMAEQRSAAVRMLAKKYTVKVEAGTP
ncbi:peptidyl-prolyl cis-trans isomerase [Piscinibacter sp. HJYY11]|uniref:peptidylprolyl isomerase n=1 Tax=Piscinibacter sp. HJYY11 TaxID=2801333 RepID=UPI00191CC224|nr:peptidylprolyl isomerase [Piscinibacter sp. HJYY11]MBL0726237.1 peptidyl-prolyl cis-trans isomerase [Piscinibacter sp. HJYY11]